MMASGSTASSHELGKLSPGDVQRDDPSVRRRDSITSDDDTSTFQWYDALFAIAGMALYVFDVFSNIRLAVVLFVNGDVINGAFALTWVVLAYIVTVLFGLALYVPVDDEKQLLKAPPSVWFCRIALTLLMLGPVVRSVEYTYNGCKARKCTDDQGRQTEYVKKMKYHYWISIFVALPEAVSNGPQLLTQLCDLLILKPQLEDVDGIWLVLTLLSSWFSLAIAFTPYRACERNNLDGAMSRTLRHKACDLLLRLSEIGGRVLCVVCFASMFRFYYLVFAFFHLLILFVSLYLLKKYRSDSIMLNVLIAGCFLCTVFNAYTLSYFRLQGIAYYLLFYLENFTVLLLWYFYTPDQGAWFHRPILIAGFLHLSLSLLALLHIFYFKWCHPDTGIPCGWEEWKKALFDDVVPDEDSDEQELVDKLHMMYRHSLFKQTNDLNFKRSV